MALVLTFTEPAEGRKRSVLLHGPLVVGRGLPSEDLSIDAPSVAHRHAEILTPEGAAPRIRLLDPDALLFVNGISRGSSAIRAGDVLHLGIVEARVSTIAGLRAPAAAAAGASPARRPSPPPRTETKDESAPSLLRRIGLLDAALLLGTVWIAIASSRSLLKRPLVFEKPSSVRGRVSLEVGSRPAAEPTAIVVAAQPTQVVNPRPTAVERASERTPLFETTLQSVVGITRTSYAGQTSLGSGFFVSSQGHILTNNHVVEGGGELIAIRRDSTRPTCIVVITDPALDLAIVKLTDPMPTHPLELGTSPPTTGSRVWAIGFPMSEKLGFTLTQGIVSGLRADVFGHRAIQHDAAINPGNSGGPLIDSSSRVVGINTWKLNGADRLGFAIPIEDARAILKNAGL